MDIKNPPRKIPFHQECPMDNLFYNLVDPLSVTFRKINLIPNNITFLSLITGLFAVYCLYYRMIKLFIVFYIVSYILDMVDGYYARKYGMVSEFGDMFDHCKDVFVNTLIFVLLIYYTHKTKSYKLFLLLIFFLFLTLVHLGVQEKLVNKHVTQNESKSLSVLMKLCPCEEENAHECIRYSRWFGNGTFIVTLCIIVYFIMKKMKKH